MKRFVTTLIAAMLLVAGCEWTPEQEKHYEECEGLSASAGLQVDFRTFTFRGHDYIWFCSGTFSSYTDSRMGGVVHDPDCRKCKGTFNEPESNSEEIVLSEYEKIFGRK